MFSTSITFSLQYFLDLHYISRNYFSRHCKCSHFPAALLLSVLPSPATILGNFIVSLFLSRYSLYTYFHRWGIAYPQWIETWEMFLAKNKNIFSVMKPLSWGSWWRTKYANWYHTCNFIIAILNAKLLQLKSDYCSLYGGIESAWCFCILVFDLMIFLFAFMVILLPTLMVRKYIL